MKTVKSNLYLVDYKLQTLRFKVLFHYKKLIKSHLNSACHLLLLKLMIGSKHLFYAVEDGHTLQLLRSWNISKSSFNVKHCARVTSSSFIPQALSLFMWVSSLSLSSSGGLPCLLNLSTVNISTASYFFYNSIYI